MLGYVVLLKSYRTVINGKRVTCPQIMLCPSCVKSRCHNFEPRTLKRKYFTVEM